MSGRGHSVSVFLGLFVLSGSCIEPFNVTLPDNRGYVVVDGLITDQPGPYTIRLFRPSSLSDQLTTVEWIRNASLTIYDEQNNTVTLTEGAAGSYKTDKNFRGVPGRTYTLRISISDDEQYESLPQKLLPVGEIGRVYYEFVQVEDPLTTNMAKEPKNGFNIFLDGDLVPEQNKLARWRTVGTYELLTYPANHKREGGGHDITLNENGEGGIWDPPLCSGISLVPFLRLVGPCTCCLCWPSIYDKAPIVSEKKLLNDNHVERLHLAFVPARKDYFREKYYFQVDQMSVTPEAFEYWTNIKKQSGTGNDLFQTPSAKTLGNMKPVGDAKTPIMGLFGVSSVRTVSFYINRSAVPYNLWDPPRFEDSCMKFQTKFNTNIKPDYWN
jgi:hypothetical protein